MCISIISQKMVWEGSVMEHLKISAVFLMVGSVMLLGYGSSEDAIEDLTIDLQIPIGSGLDVDADAGLSLSGEVPGTWENSTYATFWCNDPGGFSLNATMDNGGYLKTPGGHNLTNPLHITLPGGSEQPLTSPVIIDYDPVHHTGNVIISQGVTSEDWGGAYSGGVTIDLSYGIPT